MTSVLIKGGRVIDPHSGTDRVADVLLDGGRIVSMGARGVGRVGPASGTRVIDADGCIVAPGLIDPHVHLRQPGREEAETIATGTAAAVAGGFTTVCCMPNTTPVLDNDSMIGAIAHASRESGVCRVFAVGAVTKGRRGEELAEIALMARAGAVGFSDDGDCVASAGVMARALAAVRATGRAFMQHCQEPTLTRGASMHAGSVATRLGLGGWPREAEEIIIDRDVRLNRSIGCAYHVQHVSSGGSVEIVRRARREGQPVSAEAAPHHLLLTHELVDSHGGYWTSAKMNPPLREAPDVRAIVEGVADGTVGVLATDHAPHTAEAKGLPFEDAPFGIIGLETAVPLYVEALITSGAIGWPRLIELLTWAPAKLCGLDSQGLGHLTVGGPADVTIIDPNLEWTIADSDLAGRSRNTPFVGRRVRGRSITTIVAGSVRHEQARC
ncbi:MAG: dihydroorotase [Phycisphaerae bacterium]|nr:dihydroorotase [Phycisphaerae bacterium]